MHPKYGTFSAKIPVGDPEAMAEFNRAMEEMHQATLAHAHELAQELGISHGEALDIFYLRSRSRWSEELEARCVRAIKAGHTLPILAGEEEEELTRLGF